MTLFFNMPLLIPYGLPWLCVIHLKLLVLFIFKKYAVNIICIHLLKIPLLPFKVFCSCLLHTQPPSFVMLFTSFCLKWSVVLKKKAHSRSAPVDIDVFYPHILLQNFLLKKHIYKLNVCLFFGTHPNILCWSPQLCTAPMQ